MAGLQFMIVTIWAVFVAGMLITSGVGGAIQAAGLSRTESAPFFLVFLFVGVLAAVTGLPLFWWVF